MYLAAALGIVRERQTRESTGEGGFVLAWSEKDSSRVDWRRGFRVAEPVLKAMDRLGLLLAA